MASSVREKLQELFNQQGREAMREELARYCREVLEMAIVELEEDKLTRHQLEMESAEIQEATEELKSIAGKLSLA